MKTPRFLKKILWITDAYIASKRYPLNESLTYLGVTGTDGKTSTCSFLYEIALNLGYKPLLLTTVGAKFDGKDIPLDIKSSSYLAYSLKSFISNLLSLKFGNALKAFFLLDKKGFEKQVEQHRTTPLASEIRKTVLEYEKKGANLFIIETTSHALDQYRVFGIKYDSVAITNITNEHLDYHGTWENYASTRAKLINMLKVGGTVAINRNDNKSFKFLKQYIENLSNKSGINLIEYEAVDFNNLSNDRFYIGLNKTENLTEIFATNDESQDSFKTNIKILGKYNIFNALAAFSCFYGFNSSNPKGIADGIAKLENITGRMQVLKHNPRIIVDFAHTANGMLNAVSNIELVSGGKLWVVFGCAGERDRYKRPVMGKTAFDYADNILITSEDPRSESLFEINNQIIAGFKNIEEDFVIQSYYEGLEYNPENKFIVRFDEPNLNSRKSAILYAIKHANVNDTVLILGKGHETSMNYDGVEYPWNDIEFVRSAI